MKIAVLGMGNMGRALAGRALERGHEVTVWNRSPGRTEQLARSGALVAATAAEAARGARCVLVVLTDDAAALEVCLGDGGAMAALDEGAVLANVSTVSPGTARRLAEAGPPGRVLDSPVAGSPAAIIAGEGRFLVGGPAESVAELQELWDDLGAGVVHCGPSGAGATVKLVLNMLLITGVAALAEAVATARAGGVDEQLLRGLMASSPVVSPASQARLASMVDDAHPGWFSPELALKDLRLGIDLATGGGIDLRIGPAAGALLAEVVDSGTEWPDFAAVIEALT